jgi:hypothetical protein
MRRILILLIGLVCLAALILPFASAEAEKASVLLLISEQNIGGPQRAWWASEIDLSVLESRLSQALIAQGYSVLEPSQLRRVLRRDKAFRRVGISEEKSIKLARLSKADYLIWGKVVASSGGSVPGSSMRSCFANATVKLIRIKDARVVAYLDAGGSSVHLDAVTGGREALLKAADELAVKITNTLNQQ